MTNNQIYNFQKTDIKKGTLSLMNAFQDDPVWNKLFGNEPNKEEKLQAFFEVPLRHCLTYGKVVATSQELEGIAAWLPGNKSSFNIWRTIRSGAIGAGMRMGNTVGKKMSRIFIPMEKLKKSHMKGRDYIYLYIIGVMTQYQDKGCGGQLLKMLFNEADENRLPIYLDTETKNNVEMYQHLGFDLVGEYILPLLDLPMWGMIREPRDHT